MAINDVTPLGMAQFGSREVYLHALIRTFVWHSVAKLPETRMNTLPKDIARLVDNLCREGDRFAGIDQFHDAIEKYQAAWNLLPPPHMQWPSATWILISIGDAHFWLAEYQTAVEVLDEALNYPDGEANPYLYLRLGQSLLEMGQIDGAANALDEAFQRGGEALFEGEDPKYLTFVKTQLKIMSVTSTPSRFNRPLK